MNLIGIGRIGKDVEVRYSPKGDAVANISIAYNYGKRDDKTSQWVDATLWGKRAEALAPHLTKGTQAYFIISETHTETYQSKDGKQGTKLVGKIEDIKLVGNKTENRNTQPVAQTSNQSLADIDSDIPF
jgi:single-strand DNA-binding protein